MKHITTFVMVALTIVAAYLINAGWLDVMALVVLMAALSYFAQRRKV